MKKQTIRLNESQFNNIIKNCVKQILKEDIGNDSMISLSEAVNWIENHVEDYVTYDDMRVMPSNRAGFDVNGFIRDFCAAMTQQ